MRVAGGGGAAPGGLGLLLLRLWRLAALCGSEGAQGARLPGAPALELELELELEPEPPRAPLPGQELRRTPLWLRRAQSSRRHVAPRDPSQVGTSWLRSLQLTQNEREAGVPQTRAFRIAGQTICRGGTQRPCYKIVYFHDVIRRLGFQEALQTCRRDGGDLVSIESQSEQGLIEKMIQSYSASDGDFWIGLRREDDPENGTQCPYLYAWTDGSSSTFRNWYADEPSCGSEGCVVMYHQPSAPAGDGGRYLFQWNDDRCNMRNNFICKYSREMPTVVSELAASQTGYITESLALRSPETPVQEDAANKTLIEAKEPAWNLLYILISSIPALLLLITIAVFSFWVYAKRRREQREENTKEKDTWLSPKTQNSPSLEIYNVIKKQGEADLAGTRPQIQNSSFRVRPGGDDLCGDYDNMAVNSSESGFVTLASTESGFVTNDIYELCNDRVGQSKESAWVENEIYGY